MRTVAAAVASPSPDGSLARMGGPSGGRRREGRTTTAVAALIAAALAAFVMLVAPSDASAIGVTKCYYPNIGTCVWGGLGSGASGFANWDGNGTEGGMMPANGGNNYSRRWRITDGSGGTVAGWWTNAIGNPIAVTWSRRGWMNYQCNNMEGYTISIYCRSDNVG